MRAANFVSNQQAPRPSLVRRILQRRTMLAAILALSLAGAEGWKNYSTIRATASGTVDVVQSFAAQKGTLATIIAKVDEILALLKQKLQQEIESRRAVQQCAARVEQAQKKILEALKSQPYCKIADAYQPTPPVRRLP